MRWKAIASNTWVHAGVLTGIIAFLVVLEVRAAPGSKTAEVMASLIGSVPIAGLLFKMEYDQRRASEKSKDERQRAIQNAQLRTFITIAPSLVGIDLRSADLSHGHFVGKDFSGAQMRNAVLRDANLSGCKLVGADLTGADLTGATIEGADLTGAVLIGANLTGIQAGPRRGQSPPHDLTVNLPVPQSHRPEMDAAFRDHMFVVWGLDGASEEASSRLAGVQATRTILRHASLICVDATNANLQYADLVGADLSGARLEGTDLVRADLRGAYFQWDILPPELDRLMEHVGSDLGAIDGLVALSSPDDEGVTSAARIRDAFFTCVNATGALATGLELSLDPPVQAGVIAAFQQAGAFTDAKV